MKSKRYRTLIIVLALVALAGWAWKLPVQSAANHKATVDRRGQPSTQPATQRRLSEAGKPPTSSVDQNGSKSKPDGANLSTLPFEAQSSISRVLGRDLRGYQSRARGDGFAAENEQHNLAAEFTPAGVALRSGSGLWKLALRSYGYGNAFYKNPTAERAWRPRQAVP